MALFSSAMASVNDTDLRPRVGDMPGDVLDHIRGMLGAADRTRLNMSLPRKLFVRTSHHDRALGVLARGVRKGQVKQLSRKIREFIGRVPMTDPTRAELAAVFPEVNAIPCVATPVVYSLAHREMGQRPVAQDLGHAARVGQTVRSATQVPLSPPCPVFPDFVGAPRITDRGINGRGALGTRHPPGPASRRHFLLVVTSQTLPARLGRPAMRG